MRVALLSLFFSCASCFGQMGRSAAFLATSQGNDVLRDYFITSEAAPIATPRSCDSGYGSWTVTDTTSIMPVVSGRLYFDKKGSPSLGDPGIISIDKYSRIIGRGFFCTVARTNNSTGTARTGWRTISGTDLAYISHAGGALDNWANTASGTEYQLAAIFRGDRGHIALVKGGTFTDWNILTISEAGNIPGTLYAQFQNLSLQGYMTNVFIHDLSGKWNTDGLFGISTLHIASPANGESQTGTADGWVSCTWTAGSAEVYELSARSSGPTDKIILRATQAGASSTLKVIKLVSGVETELATSTRTYTVGTEYLLAMRLSGTSIRHYSGGSWIGNTTESFNQSATGIGSSGGATTRDFTMWPLTVSVSPRTTQYYSQVNAFCIGDSKTGTTGDATGLGYVPMLNTVGNCAEVPTKVVHGGYTVAQLKASIDADLAATTGTPKVVCLNIGVNDAGTTNAAFFTNYAYILDAIHTKWPNAKVGCMLVWSSSQPMSSWDNEADAIETVVAARSPWAVIGPDERVFLENGDNGATYTADGTHPNHAGYVLTAQKWKELFGM